MERLLNLAGNRYQEIDNNNKAQIKNVKHKNKNLNSTPSLYVKGKMKQQVNKHVLEKAREIKIKNELDQCTFQPKLNKNYSFKISMYSEIHNNVNNIKNNEEEYNRYQDNQDNIKPGKLTLYDKYKNRCVNTSAIKNKEIYMKKKVEGEKVVLKQEYKRLNINTVLDNTKTVLNDKITKAFIQRYHRARESHKDLFSKLTLKELWVEEALKARSPNNNNNAGNINNNFGGMRSTSMRLLNNSNNNEFNEENKIKKSPSLALFQISLRRELSKVALN